EAIDAYQLFLDEYPNVGLAKVIKTNKEYLDMCKAAGALKEYREYKEIELHYNRVMKDENSSKRERKKIALKMYKHAHENYHQPFHKRLIASALKLTFQERLFIHSNRIIGLIDTELPAIKDVYATCWSGVKLRYKRMYAVLAARAYIGLCLVFVLIRKGYKKLAPEFKNHSLFYSILALGIPIYLSLWYLISVTVDINTEVDINQVYFMWVQFLVLVPLALAFYHSFPPLSGRFFKTVKLGLNLLLGMSVWVTFGFTFDYLWLFGF
ncbi:MAG: hypothetical protein HRT90_10445, partial [Candidatus Margulisbacteria bacterium]|nr:hypothetical protein [Candidatus Margulisiibacteriota bacterium]